MSPVPSRVTEDYFVTDAELLRAVGLDPHVYHLVAIQRKSGLVGTGKAGVLTFEGWLLSVVKVERGVQ